MTTLLITSVSTYWGARAAFQIAAELVDNETHIRLLGLDRKPPESEIPGLEFIRADLSNPLILDLLKAEQIETVLHLDVSDSANGPAFGGDSAFSFFPRCAEAGVRRIIIKSSTFVYGARPANSLYLAESHPLDATPRASKAHVELESFVNGMAAQYSDLAFTILRFPHILGPTAETPLARFLLDDRAPTLLGFNPLFQLIHEEDVASALAHAALNDLHGVYNIAAEDALPLNKILALAGKLPLPVASPFAAKLPARLTPLPLEQLRYPCLANLDKMQNEFGFTPAHSAEDIVAEFATEVRRSRYMPDALEEITNPLRRFVQRLQRTGSEEDQNE